MHIALHKGTRAPQACSTRRRARPSWRWARETSSNARRNLRRVRRTRAARSLAGSAGHTVSAICRVPHWLHTRRSISRACKLAYCRTSTTWPQPRLIRRHRNGDSVVAAMSTSVRTASTTPAVSSDSKTAYWQE